MRTGRIVDKQGSSLVLVLCIVSVVGVLGASLLAFADYQIGAMKRAREDNMAQAIAEAGANAAYAVIKSNFANKDNASLFPQTSYNGGTFDVTVTSVGTKEAQIKSVGVSGISTSSVVLNVKDFSTGTSGGASTNADPTTPWGQSVFVNGSITHNGSGTAYGNVRCNQSLTCNGALTWGDATNLCNVSCSVAYSANGNITVHGTVTAPTVSVNGQNHIDTVVQASVPTLAFPVIDLTAYYNLAVANSQVYSATTYNGTQNLAAPAGGVRWYNGSLTFNGSTTIGGAVIATGAIAINGAFTHTKVGNLPALVSRDSTVSCNGSHTVNGLVYSKSDLTWNGSGTINGAILCGGSLTFNGSYGNIYWAYSYPDSSTNSGGSGGSTSPQVGVTAWQK